MKTLIFVVLLWASAVHAFVIMSVPTDREPKTQAAWCIRFCAKQAGWALISDSDGTVCACDEHGTARSFDPSTDLVPDGELTDAQRRETQECWKDQTDHCIAECGGSMSQSSPSMCRWGRDGGLHRSGWGCTMSANYDQCAQTYKLRQEIKALRAELSPEK